MNKVFKVIWNHATQTWTAVSELGHAKGKTKSKKIVKLTALAGAVLGVVGTAQAAVDVDSSSITIASNHPTANEATKGKQNINIGTGANTYRSANGKVSHDAIAIGSNATGTGDAAVAIGLEASATEQNGVAIGHKAKNTSQSSVAIGENATSSKDMDVAVGKGAAASGGESLAFGSEANSSAKAAISVGKSSVAAGDSAVATGYLANAGAANTVATGKSATASVDNAVAVGVQTNASARNAMALGGYSSASGERATAVGAASKASGTASFAGGTSANASGTNSVAIGGSMTPADAAQATGANTTAIGTGAKAEKDNAVALGSGSTTSDFVPTSSATVGTLTYSGFAGSNSSLGNGAVVSVGGPVTPTNQLGSARQIQNVAAGRIDAASTDAVNGSQLYVVASKLDEKIHNHHWIASGNQTAGAQHANTSIYNNGVVDFQNGNGTIATVTNETLDQSTGTKKTVVKYHANIVAGDNTTVDYNADGSVKISANVSGGTDTTAKVITGSPNALIVTNTTTDNVTTYNVSVKTGDISTTTAGAATYDKDGDNAASGNYGSRLTNVSTVTNIVNNVSWHLNSEAVPGTSGTLITGSDTEASNVRASNTVNINAGDNIAIKRNGNTIEISSTGGAKGDTGATGAKGDTGAAGAKGDTGDSITGEVVDNGDGTHTITITNLGDGSVTTTIVKDGKDGKNGKDGATGAAGKNAEASVVNNGNGTHTVTIVDGNGQTTSTVVKDGKNAEASVTNNGNGTHTLTVVDGNGNTTTTIVKDGATGAAGAKGDTGATGEKGDKGDSITGEVVDNGDGTHTITITNLGDGSVTTTIVKDGKDGKDGATGAAGKNAEASVVNNGNGTHTVTIVDGNGQTTSTVVKDGKNAEASVTNNGNGTHTVTIVDGNGQTTSTVVKDGKNAEASVTNNGNGTHTVTIVDGNGKTTTTVVKDGAKGEKGDTGAKGADGKNAEASVVNNGNGTHTVTIVDGNGQTTSTVVKDGKNAEASVTNNGNGTHTVTIVDGNGQTTSTVVKDGKDGKDGVMTWNIKSTGEKPDGTKENTKQNIKDTHTVEMSAGKNLTIEQTNDPNGVAGAKVEFALNSNVTNLDKVVVNGKDGVDGKDGVTITAPGGKDGNDGLDGKVGISGKDGKDAVSISGKDGVGQIGLTGPKGADGKDGASVTISTDKGTTTVAERDGGEKINRVIYTDKDKDGNDIKREIATLDDGLKFTGDDGQTVNRTLGSNLNIKGGATDSTTEKNIRVTKAADGEGLDVNLANNIKLDNNGSLNIGGTTVKDGDIQIGDTHIKNGSVTNLDHHIDNPTTVVDDSVLNITDEKKKEAATVGDVLNSGWNLQANGKPVDAVTHGNNVNFASDKGTVTVTANSDGKTSVVNLDVNVDNDTITVNNKGQLVASGATNFNVATKDGGNKVAKKGGSSTTKITAGKTITYTAGKNIAIEQNGGDILVSTTNDVDHNSVTTNDLTVNKGGNIDMGGNQIHNVKAGTKDTDAVNVSQLKQSIGDVHKRINKVGKEARGGIAGANAAAGLPQVYIPGKSMVAASAGTFKGESAVAVGYSRSSDNGKVIFKLQGNANTQGDVGGSVGVGYQW